MWNLGLFANSPVYAMDGGLSAAQEESEML